MNSLLVTLKQEGAHFFVYRWIQVFLCNMNNSIHHY